LTDIIELSYSRENNIILFKCDWCDVYSKGIRGYKEDKYEYILINNKRKLRNNKSYVLTSQAQQVYYVKDTKIYSIQNKTTRFVWYVRNVQMRCVRKQRLKLDLIYS